MNEIMKARMTTTRRGSEDGFTVRLYEKGEIHEVGIGEGQMHPRMFADWQRWGWAEAI